MLLLYLVVSSAKVRRELQGSADLQPLIMPWYACASEVYGSVLVCLCVCTCVDCYMQLLKDKSSASKSFYRLLVMLTWILIRGFAK